jgi:hypothetical protein
MLTTKLLLKTIHSLLNQSCSLVYRQTYLYSVVSALNLTLYFSTAQESPLWSTLSSLSSSTQKLMIHSFITSLLMYPYFNQYPYLTTLTHYHQHPTINSHFPPLLTTKLQASMSSKKTPNGLCSYPYLLKSFDSIHSFSLF